MSSQDFHRIDEVYHNIYRNKFHRENPLVTEDSLSEDEEYKSKAVAHKDEAAKAIYHKLKLEYGNKFKPEKARAAVAHALGSVPQEDCEDCEDRSTPCKDKKEKMKYLKSKGMKGWPDENAEEGSPLENNPFQEGDFITDHDGNEYEVIELLADGSILVTVSGGKNAGKRMRIGSEYLSHFLKTDEDEDSEEELGPDPKDVAEYDKAKKDISYENYPFWDAYHAVKEGAWSEDDFHQWASSVWSAGADESQSHHS